MSTSSISSSPIETSPFEEDFVLPEDPNINVPLSTRVDLLGKLIGLGCIGLWIAELKYLPNIILPVIGDISGPAFLFSFVIADIGCILLFKQSYYSPEVRRKYRHQLEKKLISTQSFIRKHGWERILHFGFFLSNDAEPLATKQHFKSFVHQAMQDLESGFFDRFEPNDLLFPFKRTALWQSLEFNLVSKEQKETLEKEFIKKLDTIPPCTLLKNWPVIEELGWDVHFSDEKKEFLKSHPSTKQLLSKLNAYKEEIDYLLQCSEWNACYIKFAGIHLLEDGLRKIHNTLTSEYTMLSESSKFLVRFEQVNLNYFKEKAVYLGLDDKLLELQKSYQIFNEEFPKE